MLGRNFFYYLCTILRKTCYYTDYYSHYYIRLKRDNKAFQKIEYGIITRQIK